MSSQWSTFTQEIWFLTWWPRPLVWTKLNIKNKQLRHQMKLQSIRCSGNNNLQMAPSFNMRILLSQGDAEVVLSSVCEMPLTKTSSCIHWTKATKEEMSRQRAKTVVLSYQPSTPPAPHLRARLFITAQIPPFQYAWMQIMYLRLKWLRKIPSTTRANFTRIWEVSKALKSPFSN